MPYRIKKLGLAALIAGLFAAVLAGCSFFEHDASAEALTAELEPVVSTPAISKDGTLVVAILENAGAPQVIEQSDGSYVGYDVDVAAALAQQLGLTCEYVACEDVADAVMSGADVVMGVGAGDSSKLTVVSHYLESALAFFTNGDEPVVATIEEIDSAEVALQSGSVAQKTLDATDLVCEQDICLNLNEAFKNLSEGEADYVLCSAYPGGYLASQDAGIVFAGTLDVASVKGVGVLTTNTDLVAAVQQAMDTITSNGVIDILRARWVGSMPVLGVDTQVQGVVFTEATTTDGSVDEEVESGSLEIGSNAVVSIG